MKPVLSALVLLILGSACTASITPYPSKKAALELHFDDDESQASGQWTITNLPKHQLSQTEKIDLHLRISRGNATFLYGHLEAGELGFGLDDPGQPTELSRDAGTLVLKRSDSNLSGRFELQANPEFQSVFQELSGAPMSRMTLINAVIRRTSLSTLQSYQGLPIDFTGEKLWSFLNRRIDAEYIRLVLKALPAATTDDILLLRRSGFSSNDVAAYSGFSAEEMVRLKRSGVGPADVNAYKAFHLDFQSDDYVALKRAGVPAEWGRALNGLAKIQTADDLVALRRAGIPPDFARAAHDHTFVHGAADLVSLRRAGVPTEFLTELRWLDEKVTTNEIIQLRRNGIPAAYHNAMRQHGAYSIDEMILMRRRGVPIEYVQATHVPGKPPLTAEAIVDLRKRGVSPETVRELRN